MPTDPDEPKLPGGVTVFGVLVTVAQLILLGVVGVVAWGRPHIFGDFSLEAYGPAGVCIVLLGTVNSWAVYHVERMRNFYGNKKRVIADLEGVASQAANNAALVNFANEHFSKQMPPVRLQMYAGTTPEFVPLPHKPTPKG